MAREKSFSFQAAVDAQRRQLLDQREQERYTPSGRPIDVSPFLKGSSADPVIVQYPAFPSFMKYIRQGNLVTAFWQWYFGAGSTFGAGYWYVPLPVPTGLTSFPTSGNWVAVDQVSGNEATGFIAINPTLNRIQMEWIVPTSPSTSPVGSASTVGAPTGPFTWAQDMSLTGFCTYYAGDLYNA